jgi:hypothetical protein
MPVGSDSSQDRWYCGNRARSKALNIDEPEKARAQLDLAVRENFQLGPFRELLENGEKEPARSTKLLERPFSRRPAEPQLLNPLGPSRYKPRIDPRAADILGRAVSLNVRQPAVKARLDTLSAGI